MAEMNDLLPIFLPGVHCPRAVTGEWSGGRRSVSAVTTANTIQQHHTFVVVCIFYSVGE